jgi:hypothetical protein
MKCTCHVGGIGEHLYSCSPPTIIEVPLPFFSEEERNLSFRRRKETFPSREMIHIHSLHIFIQLSFKSIIKFVGSKMNSINLMINLKVKCVTDVFILFFFISSSRHSPEPLSLSCFLFSLSFGSVFFLFLVFI